MSGRPSSTTSRRVPAPTRAPTPRDLTPEEHQEEEEEFVEADMAQEDIHPPTPPRRSSSAQPAPSSSIVPPLTAALTRAIGSTSQHSQRRSSDSATPTSTNLPRSTSQPNVASTPTHHEPRHETLAEQWRNVQWSTPLNPQTSEEISSTVDRIAARADALFGSRNNPSSQGDQTMLGIINNAERLSAQREETVSREATQNTTANPADTTIQPSAT